jgi:hypothetical protein
MRAMKPGRWLTVVGLLVVQGATWSQAGQAPETLIVSGHSGQAPVIRINGGSYVAVDALARLLSGSLAYKGDQVVLTVPAGRHCSFWKSVRLLQKVSRGRDGNYE